MRCADWTRPFLPGFDRVKLNAVLLGGFNDDEIPALAGLTRAYPVDVRFIEWMPMGRRPPGAYPLDCGAVLKALPELTALPPDGGVAERYILAGREGLCRADPARRAASSARAATASASRRTAS